MGVSKLAVLTFEGLCCVVDALPCVVVEGRARRYSWSEPLRHAPVNVCISHHNQTYSVTQLYNPNSTTLTLNPCVVLQ